MQPLQQKYNLFTVMKSVIIWKISVMKMNRILKYFENKQTKKKEYTEKGIKK